MLPLSQPIMIGKRLVGLMIVGGALALTTAGCTASQKKSVAKAAVKTMPAEDRRETFEATARLLDENPALTKEAYDVMKKHPQTMTRLMELAMTDLENPEDAKNMAEMMSKHPAALEQTLRAMADAASHSPEARQAINRGIAAKAPVMVDIITDDQQALAKSLSAGMTVIEKKPKAKANVQSAVRANRAQIIAFVKNDKELAKELTEELIREAVKDKPTLEKMLRATGAIDDDADKAKKK
jgi:hypothetical protein